MTRFGFAAFLFLLSDTAAAAEPRLREAHCWHPASSEPTEAESVGFTPRDRWAITLGHEVAGMCGRSGPSVTLTDPGRAWATFVRDRRTPTEQTQLLVEPRWSRLDARAPLKTDVLRPDGSALIVVHRRSVAAAPLDLASAAPTELRLEVPADAVERVRRCLNPDRLEHALLASLPPGPSRRMRPNDPLVPRELRELEVLEDVLGAGEISTTLRSPSYRARSLPRHGDGPVLEASLLAALDALPRKGRVPPRWITAASQLRFVDQPPRLLERTTAVESDRFWRPGVSEVSRVVFSQDGRTALFWEGETFTVATRTRFGRWLNRGRFARCQAFLE